ncbi:kynurenine 3-monooxygenase isoform X2 [Nematostella vectensis]|uniref:kynurenine 3-monooxygenase isoform X2 n=1 Tax=Nematostella vectensis TaxID=45351 RepID=UPI0020777A32|nr:kynurenine 3-monooxygenase isoform X2 [Nematostella vectensis]
MSRNLAFLYRKLRTICNLSSWIRHLWLTIIKHESLTFTLYGMTIDSGAYPNTAYGELNGCPMGSSLGDDKKRTEIAIIGAGLVGSLCAIYLARHGYRVDIYEARKDPRLVKTVSQRSINLALSHRGIAALAVVGCDEQLLEDSVAMSARYIHARNRQTYSMQYGTNGECIYSVERRKVNEFLLNVAESYMNVTFHFEHKLRSADLDCASFICTSPDGSALRVNADLLVGCDGAFSALRREMMARTRFDYSQAYIPHWYKEISLPPRPDGEPHIEPSYLHIWPRTSFMMIAQANKDNSFTCTLFAPYEHFERINTKEDVLGFFNSEFPDFMDHLEEDHLLREYFGNPVGSMVTIKCSPYHYKDKAVILGDAAHAMVPFYAQGMNCGFEDCLVLDELLVKHKKDIGAALSEYTSVRNPDGKAICDLAMYNYTEMRSSVTSKIFIWRRTLYLLLHKCFPRLLLPLYTMVTFSRIPYHEVIIRTRRQDRIVNILMLSLLAAGTLGLMAAFKRMARFLAL